MPGGDRTGPAGEGPMTGRKLGFCGGGDGPGWAGAGRGMGRGRGGRGFGRGRGVGRGRGWGFGRNVPRGVADIDDTRLSRLEGAVDSLRQTVERALGTERSDAE